MKRRKCKQCGTRLERKENECPSRFEKRIFCDRSCATAHLHSDGDWRDSVFSRKRNRKIAKAQKAAWKGNKKRKKAASKRMKKHNPMKDPEIQKKCRRIWRRKRRRKQNQTKAA